MDEIVEITSIRKQSERVGTGLPEEVVIVLAKRVRIKTIDLRKEADRKAFDKMKTNGQQASGKQ